MNSITYLAGLVATTLALSVSAKSVTAAVTPAKTNNVMALNFTLTAWPNATTIPRVQTVAAKSVAGTQLMNCGILPGEWPTNLDSELYIDPLPPEVIVDYCPYLDGIDTLPVDGGTEPSGDIVYATGSKLADTAVGAPFRITSKDIIASLNGVTNNGAAMHFGTGAQLLYKQLVHPLPLIVNGLGTNRQIIVREKIANATVDKDVSRFFTFTANYVTTRTNPGEVRSRKLATLSFANPGKLSFSLATLAIEVTSPPRTNGVTVLRSLNWDGHGPGQLTGSTPNLILNGSVNTSASHLE